MEVYTYVLRCMHRCLNASCDLSIHRFCSHFIFTMGAWVVCVALVFVWMDTASLCVFKCDIVLVQSPLQPTGEKGSFLDQGRLDR